MRTPLIPLTVAAMTALAACAETNPTAPARPDLSPLTSVTSVTEPAPAPWARIVQGETGPGSQYAIYVPRDWNGEVVFYAHGIRDAAEPISLRNQDQFFAFRDWLGSERYAVTYSSFSENGWAVKDGAQRTHQLRGLFASEVGKPSRSYLVGHSMGGLIAQQLAERFPSQYDGTLAMCAPLGGPVAEVDYIGNVRVVFDYFYPGVIPGNVLDVAGLDLNTVLAKVQAAIMSNPTGVGAMARIQQTALPGISGAELGESLLNAIGFNIRGVDDFLGRTHGHSMFDNSGTAYVGLLPATLLADLNQKVGRFSATPDAINYLEKYYIPNGALSLPTVTLHTARDPVVPFFHEPIFAQAVANAGASALLLQRTVGLGAGTRNGYGHCAFKPQEVNDAFTALRDWVASGERPAN